jgi:hypothetical protein
MMFSEYIKQEEPVKMSKHSVIIYADIFFPAVTVSKPTFQKFAGKTVWSKTVSFIYKGQWFEYRTDNDDNGDLWTMDEHGNKKARSVFKLKYK